MGFDPFSPIVLDIEIWVSFSRQKIWMVPSLELSIVWSRYNALKLLWRIWESNMKERPPFHTFLQIIYKSFKILVLSYNLFHFVPIFKKIDQKVAQMGGIFYFWIMTNYARNLVQFWQFVQDDVTVKWQKVFKK